MQVFHKWQSVYWLDYDGDVHHGHYARRRSGLIYVRAIWPPAGGDPVIVVCDARDVFGCREDAENRGRVIRQWVAEDAGVLEIGGSTNG